MPLEENGERFDIRKYKHLSEPDLVKEGKLPDVKGLYKWDTESKRIDAILISHSHQDHYGYLSYVNPAIPIYASEGCKELMARCVLFRAEQI